MPLHVSADALEQLGDVEWYSGSAGCPANEGGCVLGPVAQGGGCGLL